MQRPDLAQPDLAQNVSGHGTEQRRLRRVYRLTATILTVVALATVVQVTLAVVG